MLGGREDSSIEQGERQWMSSVRDGRRGRPGGPVAPIGSQDSSGKPPLASWLEAGGVAFLSSP